MANTSSFALSYTPLLPEITPTDAHTLSHLHERGRANAIFGIQIRLRLDQKVARLQFSVRRGSHQRSIFVSCGFIDALVSNSCNTWHGRSPHKLIGAQCSLVHWSHSVTTISDPTAVNNSLSKQRALSPLSHAAACE